MKEMKILLRVTEKDSVHFIKLQLYIYVYLFVCVYQHVYILSDYCCTCQGCISRLSTHVEPTGYTESSALVSKLSLILTASYLYFIYFNFFIFIF